MSPSLIPYSFEALGEQDRAIFTCGNFELDDYFHRQVGQDAKRKVAAPFVMLNPERRIVGYYTLSAYAVKGHELPPALARKLPRFPLIPATLLGRLAISTDQQGKNLGRLLLADALFRSWENSPVVASAGVVAEAINDSAAEFYRRHEFLPLASDPRKLFLAMETIQKGIPVRPSV